MIWSGERFGGAFKVGDLSGRFERHSGSGTSRAEGSPQRRGDPLLQIMNGGLEFGGQFGGAFKVAGFPGHFERHSGSGTSRAGGATRG
jgi:hypothetical protein